LYKPSGKLAAAFDYCGPNAAVYNADHVSWVRATASTFPSYASKYVQMERLIFFPELYFFLSL
jgi:hypothetical protein